MDGACAPEHHDTISDQILRDVGSDRRIIGYGIITKHCRVFSCTNVAIMIYIRGYVLVMDLVTLDQGSDRSM